MTVEVRGSTDQQLLETVNQALSQLDASTFEVSVQWVNEEFDDGAYDVVVVSTPRVTVRRVRPPIDMSAQFTDVMAFIREMTDLNKPVSVEWKTITNNNGSVIVPIVNTYDTRQPPMPPEKKPGFFESILGAIGIYRG